MKILFLIRSLNVGGAERQLIALACGLHERGYSVAVATFYGGGALVGDLDRVGVRRISLDKLGRWDVLPFLLRLYRLLKGERPDVLHSYLGVANILSALFAPSFPGMRLVWGVRASNMDLSRYDWFARISWRVECILSRFADLVIANSHAGKEYHVKHGFAAANVVVIPNGIDTERFRPDQTGRVAVRANWGIAPGDVLVGMVARLDPIKDHPTFLKAVAQLPRRIESLRFICVGEGLDPYASMLRKQAECLGLAGHLIWAGASRDMPTVYNAIDLLVLSSISEGFPNVLGEAMACDVPCVATNVGDAREIVGDAGIVVPCSNPAALAEGISTMLGKSAQSREDLGKRARARIVENYSMEALKRRTLDALESMR